MDFENNFNDNLEKENQNNITNDSMSNEYGEINFVMNEPLIKKPKKRRIKSVMGYIALVLVAAIIGGLTGSYVTANMLNAAAEKKAAESSI